MYKTLSDDSEKRIPAILDATSCGKHNVPKGIPCFHVTPGASSRADYLPAVCGRRARKAGFNGKINPLSTRTKASRKN